MNRVGSELRSELRSECPICSHARVTQMDEELTLGLNSCLDPDKELDPKNHEDHNQSPEISLSLLCKDKT